MCGLGTLKWYNKLIMHNFHYKIWAVPAIYFRMTNDKYMIKLSVKLKKKNCQNIK